jgi:hypothetical protein
MDILGLDALKQLMFSINTDTLKIIGIIVGASIYWMYYRLCIDHIKGIIGNVFALAPPVLLVYFSLTGCSVQSQQQTQVVELTNQTVIAEVTICQEAGMEPSLLKNVYGGISKVVCEISNEIGKEIELRRRVLGE